ncbi:MAG: NAD(P)/FAD-dependent oxidoreductase [Candidatus Njordarchaeia archaeon]
MPKKYDVMIIGAGPAGAAAAISVSHYSKLWGLEIETVLVDKDVKPGENKPCGGMLSWKSLQLLGDHKIAEREIQGVKVYYKNRVIKLNYGKTIAANVDRGILSSFLLKLAKKMGVEVGLGIKIVDVDETNESYILHHKDGSFKTKYLVGADGYASIVSRKIFGNIPSVNEIGSTYQLIVEMGEGEIDEKFRNFNEFYYGESYAPGGYMWIFPHKNMVHVGYGALASVVKRKRVNMRRHLTKLLKENKLIREKINAGKIIREESWPVPLPKKLKKVVKGNAILVGDAAQLVDPLTGEGIQNALISGWLAGYFIAKAVRGDASLGGYQRVINVLFGVDIRLARLIVENFMRDNGGRDKTFVMSSSFLAKFVGDILTQLKWPPMLTSLYLKTDY